MRYILHCKMSVPAYIGKTIDISSSNIVGRYLLPKPSISNDVLEHIGTDNDIANLVDTKATASNQNLKWKIFARIIDILLFIIYALIYSIMYIYLIPTNYFDEFEDPVIVE